MWCIICPQKGKHCGGEGSNTRDECLFPVGWVFLGNLFLTKLATVVHHHELYCHAKNWDSIFTVTVTQRAYNYNKNITVSAVSFISSKLTSLLQPNSVSWYIITSKRVFSENVGLLCLRSVSQPWLNISVSVSLDDIFWIAEPFLTKPSIVTHYTPECHVQKWVAVSRSRSH